MPNYLVYARKNWLVISGLALVIILLVILMTNFLIPGQDWSNSFRPAVYNLLTGRSLYHLEKGIIASWEPISFLNPPWALLPLIPFALLPENLGRALLVIVSLATFIFVAHRLGAKPWAIILLLLSPPVIHLELVSNLDWLVVMGFVLPPQIGLFFITIKPQMGMVVALFWFIEAWRRGGWKETVRIFWPITAAFGLSLIIFGLWPLRLTQQVAVSWNSSLWPYSIPVGLALLVSAVRKRKIEFAMAASPCLSPFLMLHSWVGALLALSTSLPEMAAAVIGFWILIVMRGMGG